MLVGIVAPAMAHETKCPYCKMEVIQDTKQQDNEVVLKYGSKKIEYRCVMCALAHAKTKYKDKDLTIIAPSTVKDKPVTITKKGDSWTVKPEGAAFVFQKGSHSKCQELYRAALTQTAANGWVKDKALDQAKVLSLKEMIEASK